MNEIASRTRALLKQLLDSKDPMGMAELNKVLFECPNGRINLFVHVEPDSRTRADSIMSRVFLQGRDETFFVDSQESGWHSNVYDTIGSILSNTRHLLQKQDSDYRRMSSLGFHRDGWGLYRYQDLAVYVNLYSCVVKYQTDTYIPEIKDPVESLKRYSHLSLDTLSAIPKELVDRLVKTDIESTGISH